MGITKAITHAVYQLESTRGSYVYLWRQGSNTILVDSSLPGKGPSMIAELDAAGVHPQKILITHYDVDHIGNMAMLSEHYSAEVWIPQEDAPYVTGEKARPGIKRMIGAMIKVDMPKAWSTIGAGHEVGGLYAVASPGHTPGHLAYRADQVLFVGDAFRTRGDQVIPSPRFLAWDRDLEKTSRARLLGDFAGWICPAHGEPLAWPPL